MICIVAVASAFAPPLHAQLRDSAGVAILELRQPPSHEPGYTVEAEPDLVIGSVTGSLEYLLTNPVHSRALDDGTIVIVDANRAHFEIRYYDADGRHLTTASRLGQGPCEFRQATGFEVLGGDSILVVGRDRRYSVFGPEGECAREGRFEGLPQTHPRPERVVDDTHLGFRAPIRTGAGTRPGVVRSRWAVGIYDMESGSADTIAAATSVAEVLAGPPGHEVYPYPFASAVSVAGGHGTLWIAQGDDPDIRGFDVDGQLRYVLRRSHEPPRVTRQDRADFQGALVGESTGERRRRLEDYAGGADYPDAMPYHAAIAVDRAGRLWVQRYQPGWREQNRIWDVYDDLRYVRSVEVPIEALTTVGCVRSVWVCDYLQFVTDDYVLMEAYGEFRTSQVVRHRIVPKGGDGAR